MPTPDYISSWNRNNGFPEFTFRIRSNIDFIKIFIPERSLSVVKSDLRTFGMDSSRVHLGIPKPTDFMGYGTLLTVHDPRNVEVWSLERFWVEAESDGRSVPRIAELEVALDFRSRERQATQLEELLAWTRHHIDTYRQDMSFYRQRVSNKPGSHSVPIEPVRDGWTFVALNRPPTFEDTLYIGPYVRSYWRRIGFVRSYLKRTEMVSGAVVEIPERRWSARLEVCLQPIGLARAGIHRPIDIRKRAIRRAASQFLTMSRPIEPKCSSAAPRLIRVATDWSSRRRALRRIRFANCRLRRFTQPTSIRGSE